MPVQVFAIVNVRGPFRTMNPRVQQFQIVARQWDQPDGMGGEVFTTINQWLASLCQQAAKTRQLVRIGWRETRFGPDAITAELQPKADRVPVAQTERAS